MRKGGTKTKVTLEKITRKNSRAVTFSKRRKGLYTKTADYCLLSDAKVALIVASLSEESNVSFYAYGHNSVDSVVSSFLSNQPPYPPRDDRLGFWWWEENSLHNSEDTNELNKAIDIMESMVQDLKAVVEEKTKETQSSDYEAGVSVACDESNNNNNSGLLGDMSAVYNEEMDLDLIIDYDDTNCEVGASLVVCEEDNNNTNNGLLGDMSVFNEEFDIDAHLGYG